MTHECICTWSYVGALANRVTDGCLIHDRRPGTSRLIVRDGKIVPEPRERGPHDHDRGTLVYGECAYCPTNLLTYLGDLERTVAEQAREIERLKGGT